MPKIIRPCAGVRRIDSRALAGQDFQADAPAFQVRRDHDQIVKRPGQPVEFPDHEHVTGSAAFEGFRQSFATVQALSRKRGRVSGIG
jgi:hypothetical protein